MNLRDRVLEQLERDGKPVSIRDLIRRLRLPPAERAELTPSLRRMLESGEIVKIRGTRIGLPARMDLVVGRLTCNPGGFGFVVPERARPGDKDKDVYVSAVNIKEALHGDRVVARIERRSAKGPEGRIIRVLERALQRLVGRYESDGRFGGHVVPFDRRVLHELFVPAGEEQGAYSGEMVSVEITKPPSATRNPIGRVLRVLGRLEEKGVDLKVVMAKYGLPDAFPAEVEAEAARVPQTVQPEEIARAHRLPPLAHRHGRPRNRTRPRRRDQPRPLARTATGCSVCTSPTWPTTFARAAPSTRRPTCAAPRSTSPTGWCPCCPHALSSQICSLVDGQDRLTQSVVIELDAKAHVKRVEFHDGVIKSAARMSYQQVQAIVDGDAALRERFAAQVPLFQRMDELAKLMRRRRYERGSLDFDLPEPKLVLDAAGEMTGIVATPRLDSMRAIEEFMLAANEAVAAELTSRGVGALFRIHERPDPQKVEEFCDLVASLGYRVPGDLRADQARGLPAHPPADRGQAGGELVSYLLLRTMKLARYHEENLGHFGLATEMYAHFTSPIRRYPDLVVHRALRGAARGTAIAEREAEQARSAPGVGPPPLRHGAPGHRGGAGAHGVEEGPLHGGQAGRGLQGLRHRGPGLRPVRRAGGGLRAGSGARLVDDRRLLPLRREGPPAAGGEHAARSTAWATGSRYRSSRVDLERRQIDFALMDVLARAAAGAHKEPAGAARAEGPPGLVQPLPRPGPPRAGPRGRERTGPRPGVGAAADGRAATGPLSGPVIRRTTFASRRGDGCVSVGYNQRLMNEPRLGQTGRSSLPPRDQRKTGGSMSEARSVALNLSSKELVFLQKVTRQEYHFITEDEQEARLKLRDKLLEGFFDQQQNRIVLNLNRDELLFLIKVARENYSFIVARREGSPSGPRGQAPQDRGVGLRGGGEPQRRIACARSSSAPPATSTTARARSSARSPAPTPTGSRRRRSGGSPSTSGFAHCDARGRGGGLVRRRPGHERFVRNMLAGAFGLDAVVLVVAADESVMPQTREHFEICRLLGIPRGLVVLTQVRRWPTPTARRSPSSRRASWWRARFLEGRAGRARLGAHGVGPRRSCAPRSWRLARERRGARRRGAPAAARGPRLHACAASARWSRAPSSADPWRLGDELAVLPRAEARARARPPGPRRGARARAGGQSRGLEPGRGRAGRPRPRRRPRPIPIPSSPPR